MAVFCSCKKRRRGVEICLRTRIEFSLERKTFCPYDRYTCNPVHKQSTNAPSPPLFPSYICLMNQLYHTRQATQHTNQSTYKRSTAKPRYPSPADKIIDPCPDVFTGNAQVRAERVGILLFVVAHDSEPVVRTPGVRGRDPLVWPCRKRF